MSIKLGTSDNKVAILMFRVRVVFRIHNVNIVVFFTIYLIAICFGHTTIFMPAYFF
jgi:hypothetical protein